MTTGRINQITTRSPIQFCRPTEQESWEALRISARVFRHFHGTFFFHPFHLPVARINRHFSPNICSYGLQPFASQEAGLSPCNLSHNPTPRFRGRDSRDRSLNFAIHDRLAVPIHNPSHLCQGDRSRSALTDDYVGHFFPR